MPSEHVPVQPSQSQPDLPQQQVKHCASCSSPLAPDTDLAAAIRRLDEHDTNDRTPICRPCRDRLRTLQAAVLDRPLCLDIDEDNALALRRRTLAPHSPNDTTLLSLPVSTVIERPLHDDSDPDHVHGMESPLPGGLSHYHAALQQRPLPAGQGPSNKPPVLTIDTRPTTHPAPPAHSPPVASRFAPSRSPSTASRRAAPPPDPFVDITRIRMRSQGHHCLYPGATFQGTQKSGRNSYDVTVTIVDVDFSASFLCGYLCIRGLTDDWPELTTYFDAEIIGSRYGFLTPNWGANEQEDMVHWARFPAFRHIKNKLKSPQLTMDGYQGAVFMRWKERFLVPDHRVQDINGASFAGFYYVCVDFNSHPAPTAVAPPTTTRHSATGRERLGQDPLPSPITPKPDLPAPLSAAAHAHPHLASSRPVQGHGHAVGAGPGPAVATMSGFYFHQNSEPYQQLSLQHVPEGVSTSFELR